jgi:rhamnogalacturonyl hydrolase YesR
MNIPQDRIKKSIQSYLTWHWTADNISYDVNDIWSSKAGVIIKEFYLKNKMLGFPAMAFLHLTDIMTPAIFNSFHTKKRYPIADAHLIMGYINLYELTKDNIYLNKAKESIESLIDSSYKTKNGIGWGQPYNWVTPAGTLPINNPTITTTAYCYDAFELANNYFKDIDLLKELKAITLFTQYDLIGERINSHEEDSKYGYQYNYKAYNAVAYRGTLLAQAYKLFKDKKLIISAQKNINYVINNQLDDGSWYYSKDSIFIDNIHTCFILKKLIKYYQITRDNKTLKSIEKGYDFYINNFFRKDGSLRHFVKVRIPKFRKIEVYDYAEALNLEIEMNKLREPKSKYIQLYIDQIINKFQTKEGYFITRINSLNMKNKVPYLGWPQAQMFLSLTKLLNVINE